MLTNRQETTVARLYLGRTRSKPARREADQVVGDKAVERFVRDHVAANYPQGWTLYDANGGWTLTGATEPKSERTLIVEIADPDSNPNGVEYIADAWKRFADQEAVLVSYTPAQTALI